VINKLAEWLSGFGFTIDGDALGIFFSRGLHVLIILILAFWLYRLTVRLVALHLKLGNKENEVALKVYSSVVRIIVFVPGILLAIHFAGIDLSAVFTTGGLFALAIAFAMKNLAENLVSGVMLRGEQTIKPGDVLETDGLMVRVKRIGFRATIVRTKDEKDMLIPNSQLVQSRVANYTYRDPICRVWTFVGVSYESDLKLVRRVLEKVCDAIPNTSTHHAPEVLLTEFGASSVNYRISIWIENPWDSGPVKSTLNEAIWWALKEAGITIAYPQLDVHLDYHPVQQSP
jgi:small-conductance mechanosensitive channel